MVALLGAGALAIVAAPAAAGDADPSAVVPQVVERTNAFRREQGVPPVKSSDPLSRAASRFAQWSAGHDQFGHEADGTTPSERAQAQGYAYCIVSENLGYQYNSAGFTSESLARALVEGWKGSQEHRKNLVDPAVSDIGVGVARSARTGRWYGVQMFGLPASARMSFEVTNRTGEVVRYRVDDRTYTLEPRVTRTHERCRASQLTLASAGAATITPKAGARFAVVRDGSGGTRLEAL